MIKKEIDELKPSEERFMKSYNVSYMDRMV
jgi:hypothetical protein